MIAVETTIVATALPQIVGQLGNLELYSWVFAAFLLAQTATTMVFGKLADVFGRRTILLIGIAVFLAGSILCGFARSLPWLIGFRLLQGLGAGALLPVNLTVVGDLYPMRERGRIQGWLASVWGVASVLGPLAGGLIVQHADWAWIFWINVPVGVAAAVMFGIFLKEPPSKKRPPLDGIGAALIVVAVSALMVLTTTFSLALVALLVVSSALLVIQERRAADPLIPSAIWSRRAIATTNGAVCFLGMALMGITTFLPMYVQVVMGWSPLIAGFTLTASVLGWPIGSTVAARNFQRWGLRNVMVAGGAMIPAGAAAFVLLTPNSSPLIAGFGSLVMGLGMGFLSTSGIVLVQEEVGREERGAATASNVFARNLGSTLGATALGALLNLRLGKAGGASLDQIERSLAMSGGPGASAGRIALEGGLHMVFWAILAMSVGALIVALMIPRTSSPGRAG